MFSEEWFWSWNSSLENDCFTRKWLCFPRKLLRSNFPVKYFNSGVIYEGSSLWKKLHSRTWNELRSQSMVGSGLHVLHQRDTKGIVSANTPLTMGSERTFNPLPSGLVTGVSPDCRRRGDHSTLESSQWHMTPVGPAVTLQMLWCQFFFCAPSHISGVHHFGPGICECDRFFCLFVCLFLIQPVIGSV